MNARLASKISFYKYIWFVYYTKEQTKFVISFRIIIFSQFFLTHFE